MLQEIIDQLFGKYNKNGYLSEDEVFNVVTKNNLSLFDVDKITGSLLSLGVIFKNDIDKDNDLDDRSHIDYEDMYCEIITIDESISPFIECLRKIDPPQRNEFNNLILQAKDGNEFAKNRIIEMYIRTAVRQAFLHHKKYNSPLSDNIQEALIGLINAFEKYETNKNDVFLTYATSWIRQGINRYCIIGNPHIYIPVYVREKMYNILDLKLNHDCCLCNEDYTCENLLKEAVEKLELEEKEIEKLIILCETEKSLDEIFELLETDNIKEISIGDQTIDEVIENDMIESVHNMLKLVSEREKKVLELRFGIYDNMENTLEEIAKIEDVTRERIRQIESKAIKKLQCNYKVKELEIYI